MKVIQSFDSLTKTYLMKVIQSFGYLTKNVPKGGYPVVWLFDYEGT
jgi:hypothetical protein